MIQKTRIIITRYIDAAYYQTFDRAVPFRDAGQYYENALRRADGETNKGAFGRAVRSISESEFEAILSAGFARILQTAEKEWDLPGTTVIQSIFEDQDIFERAVVERVLSRPVRDAAFIRAVREAYDSTCAATGLKLTNGRGRPEVQLRI